MAEPAIFNASPLIFLAEADLADIARVAGLRCRLSCW